jgi:hypothetical protein
MLCVPFSDPELATTGSLLRNQIRPFSNVSGTGGFILKTDRLSLTIDGRKIANARQIY